MVASYKECLKNHAASIGGLALDGCGEFMPSPNSSPLDPTSLKCAACGCHRNFHRRDPINNININSHSNNNQHIPLLQWAHHPHHHNHNHNNNSSPSPGHTSSGGGPSPCPSSPAASPTPHHSIYPSAPHMLLALREEMNQHHQNQPNHPPPNHQRNPTESGRQRARTKFTAEQKVRMQDFAERLGWKMLRANDHKVVENFCGEIGVRRNVFKVWMHNNKHRKDKDINNKPAVITNSSNNNINGNGGSNVVNGHDEHFDEADDDDDDDDEEEGEEDDVNGNGNVTVKYDLNGSSYEGRVRFDTNVFHSKVLVHGAQLAAAASAAATVTASSSLSP